MRLAVPSLRTAESGIDDRWRDLDHPNCCGFQLMAQAERKGVDRGLRGAIDRHIGHRRKSEARADVDDERMFLLPQGSEQLSDQMDRRRKIDRHFLIESFDRRIRIEIAPMLNAGVVDDDVECRMLRLQPFDHRIAALAVGKVANAGDQRRHVLLCLPERAFASTANDDVIALFGKAPRERKTDAGCAASNENCVSCELQGRPSFQQLRRCADDDVVISGHTFATGKPVSGVADTLGGRIAVP